MGRMEKCWRRRGGCKEVWGVSVGGGEERCEGSGEVRESVGRW